MIEVRYSEPDGPYGRGMRLAAQGHAGYAPAGQDIVCAAMSILMQTLASVTAGDEDTVAEGWDGPGGPRLAVTAAAPQEERVRGAFEFVRTGAALLAERYPDNVRFADDSQSGKEGMVELQLFGEEGGTAPPALSSAQERQAVASGTMRPTEQAAREVPEKTAAAAEVQPAEKNVWTDEARTPAMNPAARGGSLVRKLHSRWAAEEAMMKKQRPGFSLRQELRDPEMRRLMALPGMRMNDAYRLAHYNDALRETAQEVERGVMERVQQRAARPSENGNRPGSAALSGPDVSRMTRAQREALERKALHGATITL